MFRFIQIALISVLAGWPLIGSAGPTVYIPLGAANRVIAVDAATHQITAQHRGVENPHGLVATPDGEYLVAGSLAETPAPAGASHDTPTSKLYLIHPEHGHVMLTIPVAGWSHHEAITPDGRYVISTHATRGEVSVLDLTNNQIVQRISTGPAPNYTLVTRAPMSATAATALSPRSTSRSGNPCVPWMRVPHPSTWSSRRVSRPFT